jgi:hypothetical protein
MPSTSLFTLHYGYKVLRAPCNVVEEQYGSACVGETAKSFPFSEWQINTGEMESLKPRHARESGHEGCAGLTKETWIAALRSDFDPPYTSNIP